MSCKRTSFLGGLIATNYIIYANLRCLMHIDPHYYQRSLEDFFRNDQLIMPIYSSRLIQQRLISRGKLCSILIQRLLCEPVQFRSIHFKFGRSILCPFNRRLNCLPVTCVKTTHSLTLHEVQSEHIGHEILYSRFYPKEKIFVTCGDKGTVKIWNESSRKCEVTLEGHSRCITSLRFHPFDQFLVVTASRDYTAKLWRLSADNSLATCIGTMDQHTDCVTSIAFHPSLPLLLTGSLDSTAKLWRLSPDNSPATCIDNLEGHEKGVTFVAFHHTTPIMVTLSDGCLAIWRMPTDSSRSRCIDSVEDNCVQSVALHPRALILVVGCKTGAIILMHLDPINFTIKSTETLNEHSRKVISIVFHQTANLLATISSDKTAKLWQLSLDNSSATCVATLCEEKEDIHLQSVEFDPENSRVITTCGGTTKVWC